MPGGMKRITENNLGNIHDVPFEAAVQAIQDLQEIYAAPRELRPDIMKARNITTELLYELMAGIPVLKTIAGVKPETDIFSQEELARLAVRKAATEGAPAEPIPQQKKRRVTKHAKPEAA